MNVIRVHIHMRRNIVAILCALGIAACSSSPSSVVGPVEGFSESHLAGRFALSAPFTNADGLRIVADTLVLGADRSARRYFYYNNDVGVPVAHSHGGGYQIVGNTIRVSYTSTSYGGYGYGLFDIVTMAVLGTSSRVTRLEVDRPDGKLTYDRVRTR